jgi:hypothetical protein
LALAIRGSVFHLVSSVVRQRPRSAPGCIR